MSIMMARTYADRVEVLSDTAVVDGRSGDFDLRAIAYKTGHLEGSSLPLLVTMMGDYALGIRWAARLAQISGGIGHPTELFDRFADALSGERSTESQSGINVQSIHIAGWQDGAGFQWQAQARDDGCRLERVAEIEGTLLVAGSYHADALALVDPGLTDSGLEGYGPEMFAPLRHRGVDHPVTSRRIIGCGGQLILSTVSPAGIGKPRSLGSWPDMLGRPLDASLAFVRAAGG